MFHLVIHAQTRMLSIMFSLEKYLKIRGDKNFKVSKFQITTSGQVGRPVKWHPWNPDKSIQL